MSGEQVTAGDEARRPTNTSTRFDYIRYDEAAMTTQDAIKHYAKLLESCIELSLPEGRAKSLALTKLEECYMWTGKAIRDAQIKRNGSAELQESRKDG